MEMELDRISNLPSDVTEKILSHLPVRDAVRTSVLSTEWRYKSAMLPRLVFDAKSISTQHQTFANVVDHVLLSHIGPLYKFKIVTHISFRDMDRWILHLSRNSIKEFILENLGVQRYKVPSSMFSCQDLTYLKLYTCLLQPPSTFTGFKSLKRLRIADVSLTDDVLENMIVHCPLLERLSVEWCDGFSQLNINAPNLQVLRFMGDFEDINILNTSNLVDVYIYKQDEFVQRRGPCRYCNLLKFFAELPNIHRLDMNHLFTKYLAVGSLPEKLPKPCVHLQFLSVSVCIDDVKHIITFLCLLRMSPALEELEVYALCHQNYKAEVGKVNSWVDENQSCSFTQLRHVKIHCNFAVDLIRFLLISSPALETMTIYHQSTIPPAGYDLAKKLLSFRHASLNLEIILTDLRGGSILISEM
ncbi:putative F-box domain, leucine-rich repeat domain, L domain-containing protein [Rosa chinensis]|uniref:Putative F-box domain, leucine-rich repeat domain, L domain-containing protein n=2 Tax=Rosa chinensis TaxID=74649 RepID=A0A2P6PXF1_ROSCH|nr:putative F-box domain, leucine-rich repeat domain, L domain-containing protein [Rosa chinensis]